MITQEVGIMLNAELKTCTKCSRDFPATTFYFHVNNAVKSGLQARCKECRGAKFGETPKREKQRSLETIEIIDGKILCLHCNRWLPLNSGHFFKHSKSPTGYELKCKECKGYSFGVYQGKPEFNTIDGIEFRKCTGCDEFKENNSSNFKLMSIEENKLNPKCKTCEYQYYKDNPEDCRARSKRYRISEKGREFRRKYKKTDKYRLLNRTSEQRRRARKNDLLSTLTTEEWFDTLENWKDICGNIHCAYCGKVTLNPDQEHVIPVSNGGGYSKDNIIPVGGAKECACNQRKNNMDLNAYYLLNEDFTKDRYLKVKSFVIKNSIDSPLEYNQTINK